MKLRVVLQGLMCLVRRKKAIGQHGSSYTAMILFIALIRGNRDLLGDQCKL